MESTKCKLSSLVYQTVELQRPVRSLLLFLLPLHSPFTWYTVVTPVVNTGKSWAWNYMYLPQRDPAMRWRAATDYARLSLRASVEVDSIFSVMRRNISVRTEQREWESGSVTPRGTGSAIALRRVPLLCETELALWKLHVKQKAHSSIAAVWTGRR